MSTITLCGIDAKGYWDGTSREGLETEGAQPGWVMATPPTVPDGQFAVWIGGRGVWEFDSLGPNAVFPSEDALKARERRDVLLKTTVDTMNPIRWESFDDTKKDEWRAYRQALLDVPAQEGFPYEVIWPTQPK